MPRSLVLHDSPDLNAETRVLTLTLDSEVVHDQLITKIGSLIAPGAGGAQPLEISPIVLGLFVRDLQTIVVAVGGIDQAVAIAQDAYAKYVAPIDLPQVPNFIEPTVDRAMSYVLGVIIRNVWKEMQKNPLPPLPPLPATPIGSTPLSEPIGQIDHNSDNQT